MKQKFHFVQSGQPYYYNCKECGVELWTEAEREHGCCVKCAEKTIRKALGVKPTIYVPLPVGDVRLN